MRKFCLTKVLQDLEEGYEAFRGSGLAELPQILLAAPLLTIAPKTVSTSDFLQDETSPVVRLPCT